MIESLPALINTSTMRRVGGQLGSNFAGVFENKDGTRYYVKELESPALARNEWLAAQLYRLAGVPTLTYYPSSDPCQVVTFWEHLEKQNVHQFTQEERVQAQEWFAVHAWLANWDAIGMFGDNQGVKSGKVITIDVGGSLQFRACGDPKGKSFSNEVTELITFRTQTDNRFAYELFGAMDSSQIRTSLIRVCELSNTSIVETILQHRGSEKLVQKMLARKQFIAEYLQQASFDVV